MTEYFPWSSPHWIWLSKNARNEIKSNQFNTKYSVYLDIYLNIAFLSIDANEPKLTVCQIGLSALNIIQSQYYISFSDNKLNVLLPLARRKSLAWCEHHLALIKPTYLTRDLDVLKNLSSQLSGGISCKSKLLLPFKNMTNFKPVGLE